MQVRQSILFPWSVIGWLVLRGQIPSFKKYSFQDIMGNIECIMM